MVDLERMRKELRLRGLEAVIASSMENVAYVSNHYDHVHGVSFDCPSYAVITADGEPFLVSWLPAHYFSIQKVYTLADHSPRSALEGLVGQLREAGLGSSRVGVEMARLPAGHLEFLREMLPQASFVAADEVFATLRAVKSEKELRFIRRSLEILEEAWLRCLERVAAPSVSMEEMWRACASFVAQEGAELYWFAGESNARLWSDPPEPTTVIQRDVVFGTDLCVRRQGYLSDLNLKACIGEPPKELARNYALSYDIEAILREQVTVGKRASDANRDCCRALEKWKPDFFTGHNCFYVHSLGLEVHELPFLSNRLPTFVGESHIEFRDNMVLCFEVGYGTWLENMYLLTADGLERMNRRTNLSREFHRVPER